MWREWERSSDPGEDEDNQPLPDEPKEIDAKTEDFR